MDCSKDPACYHGAIPFVQIHCSRSQKIKLFELLDSSRRLSLHTEDEIRSRFCSGMFAVVKSLDRDRLILDSRPPNLLEIPLQRWIRSLASAESLGQITLKEEGEMSLRGLCILRRSGIFLVSTVSLRRRLRCMGHWPPSQWGTLKPWK